MAFQPLEEKEAERKEARNFENWLRSKSGFEDSRIIKLQDDEDDGEEDSIIEISGKQIPVEIRRKGYPNHNNKECPFENGWRNKDLVNYGIFLNERTIRRYVNKTFIFLVVIRYIESENWIIDSRVAIITPDRVKELLKQKKRTQESTNSKVKQSIKGVPVKWFCKI